MESTFFDFNDFGDFDVKTSKDKLKENKKNSIIFIISLILIIILGILSIIKGNELSNITKKYNELYNETNYLQNDTSVMLKENIVKREELLNIFSSRKSYEEQYEKDKKQLKKLEDDNEELQKTYKNLSKKKDEYKKDIEEIREEILKLRKSFSDEQDKNLVSGKLENNVTVHFPGDESMIGKIVDVRLNCCKGFYFIGEIN